MVTSGYYWLLVVTSVVTSSEWLLLQVNYEVRVNLVNNPSTYRMVLEYFYTGLQDFSVSVSYSNEEEEVGQGKTTLIFTVIFTVIFGY